VSQGGQIWQGKERSISVKKFTQNLYVPPWIGKMPNNYWQILSKFMQKAFIYLKDVGNPLNSIPNLFVT
jgi:hypothetical protein